MHCTKKTPTKRTTPETATYVAVFAFSDNLHQRCNKACPFAFSTKSEYKRRFFVVPAYVLQGKVFYTVVLPLFDLATISRLQQKTVGIKLVNVLLHVSVGHCTSTRHRQSTLSQFNNFTFCAKKSCPRGQDFCIRC